MHILCISDIHGKTDKLVKLLNRVDLLKQVEVIIFCGDITHRAGYAAAKKILKPVLAGEQRIFAVPGNMDKPGVGKFLDEQGINLHGRGVVFKEIGFMGLGGSNITPLFTPNEYSEEKLAAFLEKGFVEIAACPVKILIAHVPPFNTVLDMIPSGAHVGSPAVREFILKHDFFCCLSGHLHESGGNCTLGKTLCINTGALRDDKFSLIRLNAEKAELIM